MNYKTAAILHNGKIHHVVVSHAEHATHMGVHHTLLKHKAMDTNDTFDLCVVTPTRCRIHFNYKVESNTMMRVQVYRNSTVTGTSEPSRSRNEVEDNAKAPCLITIDGTVTDVGELIADNTYGNVGQGNNSGQGGNREEEEFYLPENYTWRFRITSLDDGNNVNMRMNFIIESMLEGEE